MQLAFLLQLQLVAFKPAVPLGDCLADVDFEG
jgi:hypothetical protein